MNGPPDVEAPRAAATGEALRQGNTDDPSVKALATLRARLALRGIELRELPSGGYLASRWNLARDLADVAAVERFAELVGA